MNEKHIRLEATTKGAAMETTQDIVRKMALYDIPDHMRESLAEYIINGRSIGHFLTAVLSNNLKEAFNRADEENQKAVGGYVKFLYNQAPLVCWGSEAIVDGWQKRGGLVGYLTEVRR